MRKFWEYCREWTKFEVLLLISGILLIFGSALIFYGELLAPIASFAGFFYALNQAKGKVVSHFIGIIEVIAYSWLSYKNQYYGETILFIFFIFPLCLGSIFTWIKNENKETHKVTQNNIKSKEWLFLGFTNIALFICLYFMLKIFNTDELLISTFSVIAYLTASYLIFRRSKYSFLFYIINDLIVIILWGIPVLNGKTILIPILLEPILLLINDIYGWLSWNKESKKEMN